MSVPVDRFPDLIRNRLADMSMSECELASTLGFERASVITMVLDGRLLMPTAKISLLAHALKLDPVHVLRTFLRDYQPELLDVIETALARPLLSANEAALIDAYRDATGDSDVPGVIIRRGEIVEIIAMPSLKEAA